MDVTQITVKYKFSQIAYRNNILSEIWLLENDENYD